MKLTLVHPCIGRRAHDRRYIKSWQMEPLAPAVLAHLTPPDIEVRFHDDRLEAIPFDEPTDLVALSIETYTARRSYQIASEYRRRGVPVVLGGFHATLCPDEASRYAEAVVVGEAEEQWPRLLDDFRAGRMQRLYRSDVRPALTEAVPDRRIFRGKRYLPIALVEAGRGCHFRCDFCAIQTAYDATQVRRPVASIVDELRRLRATGKEFFFFVDDNITSNLEEAKELYRALIPLRIRWVSQGSINAAHDEEFLELIVRSGCEGLLVGFESLHEANLRAMNKAWNGAHGGMEQALANLRRHCIRLYATFVFGYDEDTPRTFLDTVAFAKRHAFYIAAFNHLTPFPGTPVYAHLAEQGRLRYDEWWMDPGYAYNEIPFRPARMEAHELARHCLEARASFFSLPSILRRFADPVNRANFLMARHFPLINLLIRREVHQRDRLPLGDEGYVGELLPADGEGARRTTGRSFVAV